eukprot:CAMPEP_0197023800 /NCGR_PEP_ID=MMETSP1384-20130603/4440_1 /TAXON_ID=29189 /ORGANISM="Ammonia sp." /LENGTH=886 /DNA_ID=CAMNT_0042452067 /DNA_START=14 /DNA_END=2674 /DNA_ORIENTATION=+
MQHKSKKAGYKLDYTYDDDFDIHDGALEEEPADSEYVDTCKECGTQRVGYMDPYSYIFYCNPCWTAFSQAQQQQQQPPPQQAAPQQQQQQQPLPAQSGKKKKRNKKKKKGQADDGTNENGTAPSTKDPSPSKAKQASPAQSKSPPSKSQPSPSGKQKAAQPAKPNTKAQAKQTEQRAAVQPASATKATIKQKQKNTENSKPKSSLFGARPSLFGDDDDTNAQPTHKEKSSYLQNRTSLFGDDSNDKDKAKDTESIKKKQAKQKHVQRNDAQQREDEHKAGYDDDDNDDEEVDLQPNAYMVEDKKNMKKEKKKRVRKKKNDGIINRQFIGSRIVSKETYERHKKQKEELIKLRFGVTANGDNDDDNNQVEADEHGKKKKKKKKKSKNEEKPHINLVVIGHVDAGKSTLMGRLLYEYGMVNNKTMHKYKKESSETGKSSFAYAWVLDCHEEERKRGITVDVSMHYFETEHRCITLLDSPGHKDFIPNMISGASQADAAILVINCKTGDFETGFDINNGQTREHALIAKSLGVQQLIVAVNKMDTCGWDKQRFLFIVDQLKHFLNEIGFANKKDKSAKKRNVVFIPVSGLTGGNLIAEGVSKNPQKAGKKSKDSKHDNDEDADSTKDIKDKWWTKENKNDSYLTHKSLFELIDELRPSSSILNDSLHGPLRMSITDIYKELNVGIVATGKILSGSVMNYQQILIQPLNLVTKIKNLISIDNHSNKYKHEIAVKGDNIQLLLEIKDSNDEVFEQIKVGDMITTPHEPLKLINKFECKIVSMKNLKIPICKGHHVIIHTHSVEKPAYIFKINNLLNKKTGAIQDEEQQDASNKKKKSIRHIKADQCAIVTIKLQNQKDIILLDTYENLKELGRITIRRDGETIALGLVETV